MMLRSAVERILRTPRNTVRSDFSLNVLAVTLCVLVKVSPLGLTKTKVT